MKRKRALITGGTGFVGSHLTRCLAAEGWDPHVIVREHSDTSVLQNAANPVTLHRHDGTTAGMLHIVRTSRPSIVFHVASLFLVQHRAEDVEPLIRSNIVFGTQLVEAMIACCVENLVNTGTSWQHYESRAYSPVCLYAATKQAFEAILQYYLETSPLRVITLKLFDTYGPDDFRPKLFSLLRRAAQEGTTLEMSGGEQLVDLVYIDDVLDAFMLAASRLLGKETRHHEQYAVSSRAPTTLRELVAVYSRVTGRHLDIRWGARPYRHREVMKPWHTGEPPPEWKPRVSLREGIARMEGIRET